MDRMQRFYSILLFLAVAACQHARVELPPALIPPAQRLQAPAPAPDEANLKREKDRLTLKQSYYFWGLLPRERTYNEGSLCPVRGIRDIHQFYTIEDLVLEQLTIGIYSPRTLEIRCH